MTLYVIIETLEFGTLKINVLRNLPNTKAIRICSNKTISLLLFDCGHIVVLSGRESVCITHKAYVIFNPAFTLVICILSLVSRKQGLLSSLVGVYRIF